ncbi:MAG TPA: AraC family transcriptional regulator [Polyangiaceae bacterium]|nr:AraC family transcriptional regulator [Polyangiaceae bacterium]
MVDRLPLRHAEAPRGHVGEHRHRFAQLIYVEGGGGTFRREAGAVEIGSGQLGVVAPWDAHDLSDLGAQTDAWLVSLVPEFSGPASALGPALGPVGAEAWPRWLRPRAPAPAPLTLPDELRGAWSKRLAAIERELRDQKLDYREIVRAELTITLVELARLLPAPAPSKAPGPVAAQVLEIVEREYDRELSLATIARRVRRSPAYLTTLVRTELGRTVGQLVLDRRMAAARERLAATDEIIEVVAERVGFDDAAYFARLFRREHGLSPGAYRAAHAAPPGRGERS